MAISHWPVDERPREKLLNAQPRTTLATNSVDLVHEYDTGGMSLCLLEQITDAACAHTDKHLNEFRT